MKTEIFSNSELLGILLPKYIIADSNILKKGWAEAGKIIITEFYKSVGMPSPDWIDLWKRKM